MDDIAHSTAAGNSALDGVVTIVIELSGEPRGKGRPRFVRRTGHAFTPAKTASYEACLRHEAALAMADRPPLEGALRVEVSAYFGVPQSWSAKKRADALAGTIRPAKRPDLDNIAKMLDALNEVVWRDDAQVVSGLIEKHYSDRPRLRIEVASWQLLRGHVVIHGQVFQELRRSVAARTRRPSSVARTRTIEL